MKKFCLKLILFISIGCLTYTFGLFITTTYLESIDIKNWETESNIWVIKNNKAYDLLLLGSSHGRVFSRHINHLRVEKIIGGKMINLSQGYGGGFTPMLVFLDTFYKKKNVAKNIVIMVDPWMFYRWRSNNSYRYYIDDYFTPKNFVSIIRHGNQKIEDLAHLFVMKNRRNYTFTIQSLLFSDQGFKETWYNDICDEVVDRNNYLDLENYRMDRYTNGLDENLFRKNKEFLIDVIDFCTKTNSNFIVIIPPTLTNELGYQNTLKFMQEVNQNFHFNFHDLSKSIQDEKYFYDLDHLNTEGVKYFCEEFLKPILGNSYKE